MMSLIRYLTVMLTSHTIDKWHSDADGHTSIKVHLYFTGIDASEGFAVIAYNTFMQLYLSSLTKLSRGTIKVFFGRPNIQATMQV